jgi:hypothetical protein
MTPVVRTAQRRLLESNSEIPHSGLHNKSIVAGGNRIRCEEIKPFTGFDQRLLLVSSRSLGASGRQTSFVESPPSGIQPTSRQVSCYWRIKCKERVPEGIATFKPQHQTPAQPSQDNIGLGTPDAASCRHETSRQYFRHRCLSTSVEQLWCLEAPPG